MIERKRYAGSKRLLSSSVRSLDVWGIISSASKTAKARTWVLKPQQEGELSGMSSNGNEQNSVTADDCPGQTRFSQKSSYSPMESP